MSLFKLFGLSSDSKELTETVQLDGPFLQEDYIFKYKDKYLEVLRNTSKCNLVISRDLLILSNDTSFLTRDDSRLKLGINHHLHQFELFFKDINNYEILAVDRFVILNPIDSDKIKLYLNQHLPTIQETKYIEKKTCMQQ